MVDKSFWKKCVLFVIIFIFNTSLLFTQTIAINEIMSSNGTIVFDEDGDYEDWIELYNFGDEPVNLYNYYLSDDYSNPFRWSFPSVEVPPGGHLLVWASGKNRKNPDISLHTNFSINKEGEELILTNPEGKRIDEIAPTSLPRDKSYGRHPDGKGTWHYLDNPTPAQTNSLHLFESPLLMHYWLFNTEIQNNTPLVKIDTYYSLFSSGSIEFISCITGYPFNENHYYWRKASMERRNMPTSVNYREEGNNGVSYSEENMRGIQVKQPFKFVDNESFMVLRFNTMGFEDIKFSFAAKDEGAAEFLMIEYSVEENHDNWVTYVLTGSALVLDTAYQLFEIDFSDIHQVNNNPDVKIRIRFGGGNLHQDEGNRVTFNNFSIEGNPKKAYYIHTKAGLNGMVHPFGFNRVYQGESLTITLYPSVNYLIDEVLINGIDKLRDISYFEDHSGTYSFNDIAGDQLLYATFSLNPVYFDQHDGGILVYPNPAAGIINIKGLEEFDEINILNMKGEILLKQRTVTKEYLLDTGELPAGMYLLRIYKGNKVVTKKIQIIK